MVFPYKEQVLNDPNLSYEDKVARLHYELDRYREMRMPSYQRERNKGKLYARTVLGLYGEDADKFADDYVSRWDMKTVEPAYKELFNFATTGGAGKPDLNGVGTDFISDAVSKLSMVEKHGGTIAVEIDPVTRKKKTVAYDASGEKINEENLIKINPRAASMEFQAFSDEMLNTMRQQYLRLDMPDDMESISAMAEKDMLLAMMTLAKKKYNGDFDKARATLALGSGGSYTSLGDFQRSLVEKMAKQISREKKDVYTSVETGVNALGQELMAQTESDLRSFLGIEDKVGADGKIIPSRIIPEATIKNLASLYKARFNSFDGSPEAIAELKDMIASEYVAGIGGEDDILEIRKNAADDVLDSGSGAGLINQIAGGIVELQRKEAMKLAEHEQKIEMEKMKQEGRKELRKIKSTRSKIVYDAEKISDDTPKLIDMLTADMSNEERAEFIKENLDAEEVLAPGEGGETVVGVRLIPMSIHGNEDDVDRPLPGNENEPIYNAIIQSKRPGTALGDAGRVDWHIEKLDGMDVNTYAQCLAFLSMGAQASDPAVHKKIFATVKDKKNILNFIQNVGYGKKNIDLIARALNKKPYRILDVTIGRQDPVAMAQAISPKLEYRLKKHGKDKIFEAFTQQFGSTKKLAMKLQSLPQKERAKRLKEVKNLMAHPDQDVDLSDMLGEDTKSQEFRSLWRFCAENQNDDTLSLALVMLGIARHKRIRGG